MKVTIQAPMPTLLLVSTACVEIGIIPSIQDGAVDFNWHPSNKALELKMGPVVVRLDTSERGEPRLGMPSLIGTLAQVGLGLGPARMEGGWASWTLQKGNRHAAQIVPWVHVELLV